MYEEKESVNMRLAVSEKEQCDGLKERLKRNPMPDPTVNPEWMDGFMMLHLSPYTEDTRRPKRTPVNESESELTISEIKYKVNTESAAELDERFKNGRFKLMNFGNRISPWHRDENPVMKRDVQQCR